MRASDYIGISEGIRSREIKLQNELSEINGKISSLQNTLDSLESELDILEMELDAALSDTDEDGNVDMRRVGAIRARMSAVSSRIGGCQSELSEQENVKQKIESELQTVETEKQQTLSQIQSAANVKNQNLSRLSGGLSGDYTSIGQNLQSAFQMSLGQLSQAASILGGSISIATNGGICGGVLSSGQSVVKTSGNTAMVGGIGSRSSSTMSSPSAGNSVQNPSADLSSVTPSAANRSSKSSSKPESHKLSGQKQADNGEKSTFLSPKNVMPLSSPVSKSVSDGEVVTSAPQGDLPSSPHTFIDYLNPANYDSNGHYTGDYRSPVMQTTQALQDYKNWSNGGGIGLPSVDLRQNGGAIQSMVPAQNVFEVLDADSTDFWSYKSRPQSDYIAMATYIPLVRKYLESGKTIGDIEGMGGVIGACATNYFRNPVKVMKAGEAYIHCNDGRHRTVAAQIAKVEMPVCVVQDFSDLSNGHISSNLTSVQISAPIDSERAHYSPDNFIRVIEHIEGRGFYDGVKGKVINGCHEKTSFLRGISMGGFSIIGEPTPVNGIEGVEIIRYQSPDGKVRIKTIYDSEIISTKEYMKRSKEAVEKIPFSLERFSDGNLSSTDQHGTIWTHYIKNGQVNTTYPVNEVRFKPRKED